MNNFLQKYNQAKYFLFFILFTVIISFIIRLIFFSYLSSDMISFLIPWYDYIKQNGLLAFKDTFYDYTPLYLYFITIATKFSIIPKIYAIKLISIFFDYITAFFLFKIITLKFKNKLIGLLGSFVYLISPPVILNSSAWGQCDGIFTTFIIISIYFLLKDVNLSFKTLFWAMIFMGIALSLKLQAIFILPFYFLIYIRKRIYNIMYFFLLPIVYIITILPIVFLGRPFKESLLIYFNQATQYKYLVLHASTIFQLVKIFTSSKSFILIGTIWTAIIILLLTFFLLFKLRKFKLNQNLVINLALLFSLISPFFLPNMQSRYFYIAEVLIIIFAFYNYKYFYIAPITISFTSFAYVYAKLGRIYPILDWVIRFCSIGVFMVIIFLFIHTMILIKDSYGER